MPRTRRRPPSCHHQREWYERNDVTCDRCHRAAEVRYAGANLCHVCLNPIDDEYLGQTVAYVLLRRSAAGGE